jgi:hypothetical protein
LVFWFDRHSNPYDDIMDDTMHHSWSYRRCWTDQLITLPFLFCGSCLFFLLVFVFVVAGAFVCFFVCSFACLCLHDVPRLWSQRVSDTFTDFYCFSHCQDRAWARSATTEEKKNRMIGFTNAPWGFWNTTQLLQLIRVMYSRDRPGESQEAMDGKKIQCGTIVNRQIEVWSFHLTESSVEDIRLDVFWMLMEHRSFCDSQRAQPTLRLHSSRFVVESCDVFVETEHYLKFLETFQQFENRVKGFDPQWIAFRNFVKTGIQFAV